MDKYFTIKYYQQYFRFCCRLFLFLMIFFSSSTSLVARIEIQEAELRNLNNEIIKLFKLYEKNNEREKTILLTNLKDVATKRKNILLKMMESDIKTARGLLLSEIITRSMPPGVKDQLEKKVTVKGILTTLIATASDEKSETSWRLLKSGNKIFRVFSDEDTLLLDGEIELMAMRIDSNLIVDNSIAFTIAPNTLPSPTAEDQRTLVILMNWSNANLACTTEAITSAMFTGINSVNTFYKESTYGKISFSGEVAGIYRSPLPAPTSCNPIDTIQWANEAEAQAQSHGVNIGDFPRKIYVLPPNSNCMWSGLGSVNTNPSQVWINGCGSPSELFPYAHELGHNLGMSHASSRFTGTFSEYGDYSDGMSTLVKVPYNAPHRLQMGWISNNAIQTVTTSGIYTIDSIDSLQSGLVRALKIRNPYKGNDYYVSTRHAESQYSQYLYPYLQDKTHVHLWPNSCDSNVQNRNNTCAVVEPLGDNQTFFDSVNGVRIKQLSHSTLNHQVTVSVEFLPPTCERNDPTLTVLPATQTAASGSDLIYNVSIKNNNSPGCGTSGFQMHTVMPAGWQSAFFSESNPMIAPLAEAMVDLHVVSPQGVSDGSYMITVKATDSADVNFDSTQSVYYVAFTDNIPPSISITTPRNGETVSQTKIFSANASDNRGIARVEFYINDALRFTDTSYLYYFSWNTTLEPNGTYTLIAKAFDTSGNMSVSPPVSVTVQNATTEAVTTSVKFRAPQK